MIEVLLTWLSFSATDTGMDWKSWSKTRPFTIEALSIFNSIDVDPFTALIGGAICSQFKYSSHGDYNIANAFSSLQQPLGHPIFGLGYTPRHIVPLILRSDEGSSFLAICGVLCEYYKLDTVTAVFMRLAHKSDVPREMQPARSQWRRLIKACAGVLATSPFGTVVTTYAERCEATTSQSAIQIVDTLVSLNARDTIIVSEDGAFYAAVAEWLFSLKIAIETDKGLTGSSNGEAQLTIKSKVPELPMAGRVHWDAVFRTCFGQAWKELDKDNLIAVIASSSGLTHSALMAMGRDPRTFFLTHEVGVESLSGHGVNETIIAWFEELRRLAPRIPRFYKAHDAGEESMRKEFDASLKAFESSCKCSACGDGSATICEVSLAETVVGLGLYVARIVVIPNLYPKVAGIQEFYKGLHYDRLKYQKEHSTYSEWLIRGLTEDLPTPVRMLEVACVLFTGDQPGRLGENVVSLNRSGLYIIITFLRFDPDAPAESRPDASVQVQNGGFSYYGRFLDGNSWGPGPANINIAEGFGNVSSKPKELVQLVKLEDMTTLISQIMINEGMEAKAEEQGWDIIASHMGRPPAKT